MSTDRQDHVTVRVCTCPLIDVSVQPNEPEFVLGSPRGCPTHGRELDAKFAAAEAQARGGSAPRSWVLPEIPPEVKAAWDRDGEMWLRSTAAGHWETTNEHGAITGFVPESQLLAERSPLTEVLDDTDA